jgi:undecaprenyl-phosphate 4-deoxy-4-formamido-L-arabinose transferase
MNPTSPAVEVHPSEGTEERQVADKPAAATHSVSVVIPVYQGEHTLDRLVAEIERLTTTQRTPQGYLFRVAEVVLVHDGAIDNSDTVMQALARRWSFVKLVWLARNFGQHPATLAGAASTTSDWVVTMDEDGDHDPTDMGRFLDRALESGAQLVYALPLNAPSHGWLRNALSAMTKRFFIYLFVNNAGTVGRFHSYRMIYGEIARSLAAYCGHNVYLDIALSWVVARSTHCPVQLRGDQRRHSGYNYRRLASHFWRLVLTSGTRPLRLISITGIAGVLAGLLISLIVVWERLHHNIPVQGIATLAILICFFGGATLFSLGVIAEYLGMVLSTAVGKPLYLVVSRPPPKKKKPLS